MSEWCLPGKRDVACYLAAIAGTGRRSGGLPVLPQPQYQHRLYYTTDNGSEPVERWRCPQVRCLTETKTPTSPAPSINIGTRIGWVRWDVTLAMGERNRY